MSHPARERRRKRRENATIDEVKVISHASVRDAALYG
jgi:hypothetical protein